MCELTCDFILHVVNHVIHHVIHHVIYHVIHHRVHSWVTRREGAYYFCLATFVIFHFTDEAWLQSSPSNLEGSQAYPRLQRAPSHGLWLPEVLPWVHHPSKIPSTAVQHHQTAESLQADYCQEESASPPDRKEETGRSWETQERRGGKTHEGEADGGGRGQAGSRETSPGGRACVGLDTKTVHLSLSLSVLPVIFWSRPFFWQPFRYLHNVTNL